MKQQETTISNQPEFKPGNKPYLKFGNEILNNNVPWSEVLGEILSNPSWNVSRIAARLGTTINMLKTIVDGNNCPLTFKQGARLLTIREVARHQ